MGDAPPRPRFFVRERRGLFKTWRFLVCRDCPPRSAVLLHLHRRWDSDDYVEQVMAHHDEWHKKGEHGG